MDIQINVNNATLKTANGVGVLDIVGNTNITQSVNVNGDSYIKGNSKTDGTMIVDGSSLLNGDVTIANELNVPTINVTHLYQPSNWSEPIDGILTVNGIVDSGTIFFIKNGTTIVLPTENINIGANYRAIITSTASSSNNNVVFMAQDGILLTRTIGAGSQTGSLNNIYLYTDTDLGTVGSINTYVFNTSWTVPILSSTLMVNSTVTQISFNITDMTIGDNFDIIYIGDSKWIINGYINNISSMN